jgi:uncharacterized protein
MRFFKTVLAIAVIFPMTATAFLYTWQARMIFYPQPLPATAIEATAAAYPTSELIALTAADGVRITAWLMRPPGAARSPLVMYFGGNGQEVSQMLAYTKRLPQHAWLIVAYRGYGWSGGEPSEAALYTDAEQMFDHVSTLPGIDTARIHVLGYSLGSGVATHIAAKRPISKVVLLTPFDSIAALAKRQFGWLPVDWILQHRFDSLSRAPMLAQPLLAAVAENDQVIPTAHSRRLFDAWKGDKTWLVLKNTDHNALDAPALWPAIQAFLATPT